MIGVTVSSPALLNHPTLLLECACLARQSQWTSMCAELCLRPYHATSRARALLPLTCTHRRMPRSGTTHGRMPRPQKQTS